MKKTLLTIALTITLASPAFAGTIRNVQILQRQMVKVFERLESLESKTNTEVYDHSGAFIGTLHSDGKYSETNQIYVDVLDAYTGFTRGGKIRGGNDYVYFSERNCTGNAFIYIGNYRTLRLLRKFANRNWVIEPTPSTVTAESKLLSTGCNNTGGRPVLANPAVEVGELELPFNSPVVMPLRFK